MANALELHRQLANNSKKKNVIDMADIKSIADNARVQQTTAPLNTANIQNNIEPIQSASLQNLPTLKGTATFNTKTQDTINKLSEKGNEVEKWNLISGLTKFGAGVATAAMPYNEGKSVRSGLQNVANDQAKKASDLSEFSNEELAEAYNNMGNYNILERIADPNKRGQYSAKQLTAPYAMIDAYNKIEEQGGIDEFNSRFGSDKLLASHFSDVGGLGSVLRNGYLKPFADKYGISEDALSMLVNAKANSELEQMYSDYAKEHPVASSALSVPANVLGSVPSTLYGVKNAITGETIDTNSPFYFGRDYASTTRGTVSEGINSDLGKFAYNTGMSMGDSLASMAVGYATGYPAIGTAIMGAGAYSDTLKDGIERGLTPDAAQATALGAGLAEYGFEKISWGRLGDIAEGKIDAKLWQQIASQMATEGGEELATDLTNMLVDNLVNGGASEMMQQKDALVAQGMDEASAEKQVMKDYAKQLATSFAGGAVSGGIMGGGASVINTGRNIRANLAAAQNVDTQADTNTNIAPEMDMLNPASIFNGNNTKTTTESNQNTEFNPLKPETIFKGQNTVDNAGETSYNENVNGNIDLQEEGTNYGRSNGETEQNGQFGNDRADEGIQRNAEELSGFDNGISSGGENTGGNSGLNREFLLIDNDSRQKLNNSGVTDNEFRDTSSNPELFSFALEEGKKNNKNGIMVDSHTAQDLRDGNVRTFLSKDNNAGGAIEADGNIIAVFKNKQSASKQAGADIIITALENGGDRLDCYGKDLVRIYSKLGFEPVARVKFNKEYAAPGWDSNIHGEPDIYFMVHNGKSVSDVVNDFTNGTSRNFTQEDLDALPYMEYGEAKDYRDGLIEQRKAPDVSGQNITPQNAVNVNTEQQTFSGTKKVNSMPEMSKNLQRYINMHGSENANQLYIKFNDAVNNALENADLDSFNEAILLAEQIENNLQTEGHNYTTKGSKNGKKPGRTYQYEADSFMGTFNSYMSDMNEKYLDSKAKLQSAENNNVVSIPATRDNTVSISEPVNMAQTSQTQNSSSQSQSYDSGNQYVSKTVKNSIMNSEMVKRAQENLDAFQGEIDNGNFKVDKVSEKESIERAAQNLSDDYEGTMKRLSETDTFINGVETDESMMILDDMLKEAEHTKDYSKVMQWSKDIAKKAHNAGQALQALAKYTRTPAGTIAKAEQLMQDQTDSYFKEHKGEKSTLDNSIDDLWAELEKAQNNADFLTIGDNHGAVSRDQITKLVKDVIRKNKGLKKMNQSEIDHIVDSIQSGVDHTLIAEEIQNYAATGLFGISDEDMEYIMDILGKAEKMPDSKERYELENMAFDRIANRVVTKKSFMDKLDAWRYLAMLSNPKTVLRNVLGNKLNGFRVGIDNSIAALIEKQISKKFGIERTKEILDRKADAELIKAATADAEQKVYSVLKDGGDKYRNAQSRIESSKSAFNSKFMQSVDNLTTKMLDDFPAMKAKYGTSLAGYMKANDMDMSYFNVEEDLADAKSRLSEATEKSDISRIQKEVSDLTEKKNKMDKARAYAVDKAKYATFHESSKFASYINTLSSNLKNGGWLGKAGHMVIEGVIPFKKSPANILKQGAMLATGPAQAGIGIYQLYNALKYGENSKYDATKAIERIATGLDGTGIMLLGGLLSSLGLVVSVPDDEKDNKYNKLTGGQNYALKLGDNYYTIDWLSPVAIPLFVGVDSQQLITNKTDKSFMDVVADMSAPMIEMSMLQGLSNTLESASNSDSAFDTAVEIGASAGTNYLSQYVPTLFGQVARTVDNTRRDNVGDATGVAGDLQYALNKAENKVPFLSMTNQPYIDAWGNQQKDENNILLRAAYNAFSPGYYSKQEKDSVEKELDVIRNATDDSSVYPSTASRKVNTVEGEVRLPGSDYTQYATKKGNIQHDTLNTLFKSDVYKWLTDAQKADVVKAVYKNSGLVSQNAIGYKSKSQDAYEAYKSDGVDGIINLSLKSAGLSESAISVINEKGADGYKKYTEMKSAADTDGNGNIKQAEIKAYLDGQVMLDAQKAYWFDAFCPNAKENPYRKANDKNTTTKTTSNTTDDEYLRYVKSILGH